MKKNNDFLFYVFLICVISGFVFYDISYSSTLVNKTIGGNDNDYGYSVQQTSDDGYIIVGSTESYGSGGKDAWLIKIDTDNEVNWEKTFGGQEDDIGHSVQQTSDGGYIIAGFTESFGEGKPQLPDIWLIKTDSNGDKMWEQTFGGDDYDYAHSIQQTSDGGYIQ